MVNDYLITLEEEGTTALVSEILTIQSIANQCPLNGGEAVFQARVLATLLGYDTMYDDQELCAVKTKSLDVPEIVTIDKFRLSPNPANELLTIDLPAVEAESFRLYNSLGRLAYHLDLSQYKNSGAFRTSINVAFLPPGFYVATLFDKNGGISSQKITISR
jgi:hypothetical protein